MTTITKEISSYQTALDQLLEHSNLHPLAVLKKQAALEQFLQLGIPTMKHEDWKYTYLQKILNKGFDVGHVPAWQDSSDLQGKTGLPQPDFPIRIVLVDGHFDPNLSNLTEVNGLEIASIAQILNASDTEIVERMGRLADTRRHALSALNLALAQDGVFIRLEKGASASIELVNMVTDASKIIRQPYLQMVLETGAQLKLLETQILIGEEAMLNQVSEVFLGENAGLEWVKMQNPGPGAYFIDSTYVEQSAESNYRCSSFALSGELLRNQQFVLLSGERAHADLSGLYLLDREEQADYLISVRHKVPNCTSNQLFKGIMDGKSTGVFNGKIIVDQDAQQTNAYQSNKNILVSDEAAAYFRPQLEIFANDVKCSHGATSSEIEDSELFYLRARGISKQQAKSLLMLAFAMDVVEHISNPGVREEITRLIEQKLRLN